MISGLFFCTAAFMPRLNVLKEGSLVTLGMNAEAPMAA
jgi:hypothetical protein